MGKEKTGDCSTTAGVVGQAIQENRWSEIETVREKKIGTKTKSGGNDERVELYSHWNKF